MEFVLTFAQPVEHIERSVDPVHGPSTLAPWMAYMGELAAAGVMRGGNRLSPPRTASTVRMRDGVPASPEGWLLTAAKRQLLEAARPGPFQLEAVIQSAHASRRFGGPTPWPAIATLYERLLALAPTVGARIGHAMAIAQAHDDPRAGLALLEAIVPARDPAVKAHLSARLAAPGEGADPAR